MFEGPGPTMNEVDTQFSILIAHYLASCVILNFPPFLVQKRKEIRVGKTPELFCFAKPGNSASPDFRRALRNPAIVT